MEILIKILTVALITYYVTTSYIFKSLREHFTLQHEFLGKLVNCQECAGVWIGFAFLLIPIWICNYIVIMLLSGIIANVLFNFLRKYKN